jgi:RHS repeat-associated protein
MTRVIPARGNTTGTPDYTYATVMTYFGSGSKAGMLSGVTDALGNLTTFDYDAVGRLTSRVDPLGNPAIGGTASYHTTSFTYDKEDRLRTQAAPGPRNGTAPIVNETRYDEVGNPNVRIDASGQVTTYAHDERDGLFQVKDSPNGWTDPASPSAGVITTEYAYDAAGNLTRMTRAKGDAANERVTDYASDGRGLVRTETQYPSWPATTPTLVTATSYDPDGNRLTAVDPLAQTTTNGYDALNRLTSISYSDGVTPNVTYGYDGNGNRTSMADGTGSSSYAYDEANRLTSTTTPGPKTIGYRYDLDGDRTKVMYPDATAVTYTFNKGGQLGSLQDWAARSVTYAYWPDGLAKTATNPDGTTAAYAYDNTRRLLDVAHTGSTGQYLDRSFYTLNAVGNVTNVNHGILPAQVARPDGLAGSNGTWTGTYASINEVTPNDSTFLASPTGPVAPNYYEVSLSDVQAPMDLTGMKIRYRIAKSGNDSGQVTSLTVELRQGSTVIFTNIFSSLPGASGTGWLAVTDVLTPQQAASITNFNDLRLRFTPGSAGGGQTRKAQISWAAVDLPSPADAAAATAYGYDRLNRLTSSSGPDGAPTYGCDPVGNRTSKVLAGTTTTYSYDRADRMTAAGASSVTVNANGNTTAKGADAFGYDQANRLKTATVGGSGESYIYDGDGTRFSRQLGAGTPIRSVSDVGRNLPVTIDDGTRKYVYGLGLAYAVSGSTAEVYHADRLGTIRALTTGGTVVATYRTDDWGNLLSQTGSSTQPFVFTGEPRDATGLTYLRTRYYNSEAARLMSRDPLRGQIELPATTNRYSYVQGNPVNAVDPSGRLTLGVCLGLNVHFFGFGVEVNPVCVVVASSLQVGLMSAAGGGGAIGAEGSVSLVAHASNGDYIEDLGEWFTNVGGSAAVGGGASGSVFWGSGRCGQEVSGVTGGPSLGGGAEGHVTKTYTQIWGTIGATPETCSKNVVLRN